MDVKSLFLSDAVIELHKNETLSTRPYLFRIYTYNNYTEFRLEDNDLKSIIDMMSFFLEKTKLDKPK